MTDYFYYCEDSWTSLETASVNAIMNSPGNLFLVQQCITKVREAIASIGATSVSPVVEWVSANP